MLLLEKSIGQSSFAHTWIHARLDDEMQSGREVRSSPTLTHMCDACRTSRATTAVGREMMTDSRPAETNSAQSLNDSRYNFFLFLSFLIVDYPPTHFFPFTQSFRSSDVGSFWDQSDIWQLSHQHHPLSLSSS